MLAGNGYLFQIVLYLVMVVDVRLRRRGETDDGIHGRLDIVGHPGTKLFSYHLFHLENVLKLNLEVGCVNLYFSMLSGKISDP